MGQNDPTASELQTDLERALQTANNIKCALADDNKNLLSSATTELNALTSKLGLVEWAIDETKLQNIFHLNECLQALIASLENCITMQPAVNKDTISDSEIVCQASGGSALYGVALGICDDIARKRAAKPILQQPISCSFSSPTSGAVLLEQQFSSINDATNFRSTCNTFGKSYALDVKASYFSFSGGLNAQSKSDDSQESRHQNSESTKSVAYLTYAYVPLKSFYFSKCAMRLSEEARQDALQVTDEASAMCFLEVYGSHLLSGIYEFGGIMWKIVEMSAAQEISSSVMMRECMKHVSGGLSVGYNAIGYGCNMTIEGTSFETNLDHSATQTEMCQAEVTKKIECLGPSAPSCDIFRQLLAENRQSWHIIDRPNSLEALVPIWELLATEGYQHAAELIRLAWLNNVKRQPDLTKVIEQATVKGWLGDPKFEGAWKDLPMNNVEAARLNVRKAIREVSQLNFNSQSSAKEVVDFFLLLLRVDMEFNLDMVVDTLRKQEIQDTLKRFAASNKSTEMEYLNLFFEAVIFPKLAHVNPLVKLDESFCQALKKSAELAGILDSHGSQWQAPIVDISSLPSCILELVKASNSSPMIDTQLLTKRIGEVIVKNLATNNSFQHKDLWAIAQKYTCCEDGFTEVLNEEKLMHLVQEMEVALENKLIVYCESDSDTPQPKYSIFDSKMYARPADDESKPLRSLLTITPRPNGSTDMPGLLLYILKHRLDFENEIYLNDNLTTKNIKKSKKKRGKQSGPIVYDALLTLSLSLTPMARAQVFQLLLDKRFLVPFLLPRDGSSFESQGTILGMIDTLTTVGRSSLMHNVDATRIALISQRSIKASRTKEWIKNVFQVHSIHCLDCTYRSGNVTSQSCVAELGWGFVKDKDMSKTVMLLHVIGDATQLQSYIDKFADILIVDAGKAENVDVTLSNGFSIHWRPSLDDEDDDGDEDSSYDEEDNGNEDNETDDVVVDLRCDISKSYQHIGNIILNKPVANNKRHPLHEIKIQAPLIANCMGVPASEKASIQHVDFSTLKTHKFKLQQLFAEESKLKIARQRDTNTSNRSAYDYQIKQLKGQKTATSKHVVNHPLIQYFIQVLILPSTARREMMLVDLENFLASGCQNLSQVARERYRQEREKLNCNLNFTNQTATLNALAEWSNMVTNIEHIWREISHIFASNTIKYRDFPRLAVQHLLDGFPLELMDGDASMVNTIWIRAIFNGLEDELKDKRVFVLSIMGVQSSGKSTLLNYMFGVRLRTSVARCTRGVNIQLLQCDGRTQYDYVLLLDTEGIRSPEYIDSADSVWRDNRMAALAILPADATIILTKGESTITISEILPIVLSVYLDSILAEKHDSTLATQFYFAFNQIDVKQSRNMETIIDTLMKNLRENAKKVQQLRRCNFQYGTSDESSTTFFQDFQSNINVEDLSDVRFFGMTQGPNEPPSDAPIPDYGERSLKFRDHIHLRACQRMAEWKARTFGQVNDCIDRVWKCIGTSNFQMEFIAAYERISYEHLIQLMTRHTENLAKIYTDAYNEILQQISADSADSAARVEFNANSHRYETLLETKVVTTVLNLDTLVEADLKQEKYAKWALDMERKWIDRKKDQEAYSIRLIRSKVEQVFNYDKHVKTYKNRLQEMLTKHILQSNYTLKRQDFEKMFRDVLQQAENQHEPIAKFVYGFIDNIFKNGLLFTSDQVVQLFDMKTRKSQPRKEPRIHRKIFNYFSGVSEDSTEQVENEVTEFVISSLANVDRYSDDVVYHCINKAKKKFHAKKWSTSLVEIAISTLHSQLRFQLKMIQHRWDEANSVASKFALCKESMWVFATNLCKGHKAADLLIATLDDWLKENLPKAFQEELVAEAATLLKGQSWVQSAEVMQATLDKDLLRLIKANDTTTMIKFLKYPEQHSAIVTSRLIETKVKECFLRICTSTCAKIRDCIVVAANTVLDVQRGRSERFVHELQLQLQKCLKLSGTSALVQNLPKADDNIMNCDDQDKLIFSTAKGLNVLTSVLKSLELYQKNIKPNANFSAKIANQVLQLIRSDSWGASNGVVPRCGKACPMCGCPCTKAIDHVISSNANEALHDSFHQPSGIAGIVYQSSNSLAHTSCTMSVLENENIYRKDESIPFKEFTRAFPTWALPTSTEKMYLREYIFAHYQDELADLYNCCKSKIIPSEYEHDRDDLERRIDRILLNAH